MLKRLLQSLGLVEKPKRRSRPANRFTPAGGSQKRCRNCSAILPASAFRCAACGARVLQAGVGSAEGGGDAASGTQASTPQLGELERRILLSAAAHASTRIVSLPSTRHSTGEVKAGKDRYEGDAALTAMKTLVRRGYVAESGDGSYLITPEGQTLVGTLRQ